MPKKAFLAAASLCAALCAAPAARAAQEIRLWHAMDGAAGAELERLAAEFNAAQAEYRVVPSYKGSYEQTLAAALAARKQATGPHIVQVNELGTADLMAARDEVRPLWQVMSEAGHAPEAKYLPAVADYFSDAKGRLLALPLNTATPVLYYNRDAFKRARLDPSKPPKTWYEMPATLGALRDSGSSCPFTTAWPSWVLLENMSAWHNQEFATHHNGMDGAGARLAFNHRLMVRWIAMLSSWLKSGYFEYSGRGNEGEARFASGECALLTSSSASYAELRENSRFDLAVAQLPYYDDFGGAPQNTLGGGAALWVMAGRPKADYHGVARFLAFLERPEVQAEWHQKTGYVPLTMAAYELTREQGFYAKYPGYEVAVRQLVHKQPTGESKGIRLAHLRSIRGIIDEELESVWRGGKTPLDALNAAVSRGNAVLDRLKRGRGG
jgi:sn-glycerol 3-phosphate transport system substrate-binding protein